MNIYHIRFDFAGQNAWNRMVSRKDAEAQSYLKYNWSFWRLCDFA